MQGGQEMEESGEPQDSRDPKSLEDCYDCLYTRDKHKKETNQKWRDGIFVYNNFTGQMTIYDAMDTGTKIAQQFKKDWVLYDEDEVIHFQMCLCTLEGKRNTPVKQIKAVPEIRKVVPFNNPSKEEETKNVKKLKRNKFKVPERKKEVFTNSPPRYDPRNRDADYYSYGDSGFKNNIPNSHIERNNYNSRAPYQRYDQPQPDGFREDYAQEEDKFERDVPVNPVAATVDDDVNDFFNRVKAVKKEPKKDCPQPVRRQLCEDGSDSSFHSGDEDFQIERKIQKLSKLGNRNNNSTHMNQEESGQSEHQNRTDKSVDKLAQDLAEIYLRDTKKQGEEHHDNNPSDIFGSYKAENQQVFDKGDSCEINTLLGQRRKRDQIEDDNPNLPSPKTKKRVRTNSRSSMLEGSSKMITLFTNERLESFEDTTIDFQEAPLEITNYDDVYRSRTSYSKYYILSLLEMLKYEIEEDFTNKKVKESPIISAKLECVSLKKKKKGRAVKVGSRTKSKNLSKEDERLNANKKIQEKVEQERKEFEERTRVESKRMMEDRKTKLQQEMRKPSTGVQDEHDQETEQEQESSSEGSEEADLLVNLIGEEKKGEEEDVLGGILGEEEEEKEEKEEESYEVLDSFYLNVQQSQCPMGMKKGAQKDDLWMLMKNCMNTTQNLRQVNDFVFVKTCWHGFGKSKSLKVKLIGNASKVKPKLEEYKYAFRSINLNQYTNLVNNLIAFRDGPENKFLDSILYIGRTTFFEPLIECEKDDVLKMKEYFSHQFSLNRDQKYVMEESTKWFLPKEKDNETKQNVLLVHGAFGCGKSYMLVAIIRFISALLDHIGDTEIKILVSSLTNVAVDRILLLLLETGFEDFARVGSLKRINKLLLPYSHHARSNNTARKEAIKELEVIKKELHSLEKKSENTWKEINSVEETIQSLKEQTVTERREQLKSKRVVGCTLAATTFEVLKKSTFKIVILDECSQMLEPHSLQAIVPFGCEKLIAVGDPLQLPPIVSLGFKDLYNKQKQDKRSLYKPLFVRLQYDQLETILLRVQYRCHPCIGELSNNLFYENELEHGVNAQSREKLLSEFEAINFINAEKGKEAKSQVSYCNHYEAKFIVALLEYLQTIIENKKIAFLEQEIEEEPDFTIGVIVTYKAQEDLIKRIIQDMKIDSLSHVQISTVDAFQGAERDVIILGCVRTRSLGFMSDYRRLNVAITRAKRHLILVGHEKLLKKNPQWKYIIDNSKALKKGYKKCEEYLAKGKIFRDLLSGM
ncbi:unnamed protein product [Moneuplotes crassus]|uniref:Uncharacterized protein n=1 Tax=Euplotes crassus TaxID=5936 RepID=A0AAD1UHV8_EUPCR|nr:unnamed protein product [Moneuplotes crassus]